MKRTFFAMVGVAAVLALGPSTANAAMVLTLNDGVNPIVTVFDGGLGDSNVAAGAITWVGSIGNWTVSTATGLSKPVIGSTPEIDLSSIDASSAAGGTLTVGLTDTDFGWASPFGVTNLIGGVTVGTVMSKFGWDSANAQFGYSSSATIGPFGPGAFSHTAVLGGGPFGPDAAFSLSNEVTITHGAAGTTSFNSVVMVPAPGAMLLGVLGLGMVGWVRKRLA